MKKEGTTPQGAPDSQAVTHAGTGGENDKKVLEASRPKPKGGKNYVPNGKGRGGNRGGGRPPKAETIEKRGLKDELDTHVWEEVEVIIKNRRTGETISEKRTRLRALLDTLAEKGLKNKDVAAIREYFDRTLGKAPQSLALKHTGEVGVYTAKKPSKAALSAKKAYERSLED